MTRSSAWEQGENGEWRTAPRSHLGVGGRCVCTVNKREEVKKEAGGARRRAPSANEATMLE